MENGFIKSRRLRPGVRMIFFSARKSAHEMFLELASVPPRDFLSLEREEQDQNPRWSEKGSLWIDANGAGAKFGFKRLHFRELVW
jgi:hypothetical protein